MQLERLRLCAEFGQPDLRMEYTQHPRRPQISLQYRLDSSMHTLLLRGAAFQRQDEQNAPIQGPQDRIISLGGIAILSNLIKAY